MASKLVGHFKYESIDNFEAYMKAIGVNIALRKIGNMSKPSATITIDGKNFTLKSESTFKTFEIKGIIGGEEFDEPTTDGRKCKSTLVWDGDKLVQTQKWNGDEISVITRYIDDQGRLICEFVYKDIIGKRLYTRA